MIKLSKGTTVALVAAGLGAIDGIVTSYAISDISSLSSFIAGLSPIVVGGIIGVGLSTSLPLYTH
jgi:hypothetical protein